MAPASTLPFRHILLALLIVVIWGVNFVAIAFALDDLPPFLLTALRFIFVAFPLVCFLPRPAVKWSHLLTYGLAMFAGQFSFLFLGMKLGVSAGLTSVVLQVQVLITIALGAMLLKERISVVQILGALVAVSGFVIVAANTGGEATAAGLLCIFLAALSWAFANVTSRRLGRVNALALVVWGSLVVPVPMLLASLAFEGPARIWSSLAHVSASAVLALAFIVYISTLVAYSLWSWLLARHPASSVSPFTLLVPLVAMFSSAWLLGEHLAPWKLLAASLVLTGLALNVFAPRLLALLARSRRCRPDPKLAPVEH